MVEGNGRELPFATDSFDCVMMVDVLHHDTVPGGLLAEAKRVSRDRVLIKDHYWETRLDLFLLRHADDFGNKLYGIKRPYAFLNLDSWRKLIERHGLEIADSAKFRFNALDPCKHVVFELLK
jgi:SAM-dependent methyltransferase